VKTELHAMMHSALATENSFKSTRATTKRKLFAIALLILLSIYIVKSL